MRDADKTKEQLIKELETLRRHVAEVEKSETERKRAEKERPKAAKIAKLMEAMMDGVSVTDLDGKITNVNAAFEKLTGYTKDELIGETPLKLNPQRERKRTSVGIRECIEKGFVTNFETVFLRKDKKEIPVLLNATLAKDAEGKPKWAIATFRDITERKRAEKALQKAHDELEIRIQKRTRELIKTNEALQAEITERKKAEERLIRLASAVEMSTDSIVIGDTDVTIVDVNEATLKMYGTDEKDDLIGRNSFDLIAPEEREKALATLKEVLEKGYVKGREYHIITKDGSRLPVEMNSAMMKDEDGKPIGFVAISRDITERKRVEEALARQAQELARSNAELEEFTRVVSHDLQEPLRMVASYVQLLARRYRGKLDTDADEFIAYAVDGVNHMQELINDLWAYSRVGTHGKGFKPVHCTTVLDRALDNLEVAIDQSSTTITCDPLPTVTADASQLVQLFQNLISNAIKFRDEDSPRVHISAEQKQEEWVFSIRDNGIGFEPQYAERIFSIFERLHTREQYPGTGIGLAICKKIMERHGGRIWVESQVGRGSTFYFTIPVTGGK